VLLCAGTDEGVYAWVSTNYALGTLQGDPAQTTGIVELGGASAQVPTPSFSQPLKKVAQANFSGKAVARPSRVYTVNY
jgi:Golgi nucleoside diphosphatase